MAAPSTRLRSLRYEIVWSLIAAALAVFLAFVPLTNVLGYEFATCFCLFAIFSTSAIAFKRMGDGTLDLWRNPLGDSFILLVGRGLLPLLLPFVLILLNALRVPNCDLPSGVFLYLLLPCSTVALVGAYCLLIGALFRPRWLRVTAYILLVFVSIASSALHLLLHPPIYAYHPLVGYFAGSVYDEAMTIPDGLLAFRLMGLASVVAILAAIELGLRRFQKLSFWGSLVVLLLASTIWLVIYSQRFELRIEASRHHIEEALGGLAESEHFRIYYPIGDLRVAGEIQQIVEDHEFRYRQYRAFFGVEPRNPVRSFIYSDHRQKERFMGAARTLIARPWLAEMHLTWVGVGEGAMAHELAHIFSAPLGAGPLQLGGRGPLHLDMGLVEGIAEAASWDSDELTLHGWSAALYRLQLAPDLSRLIGASGFWSQYSRVAYTLMGSFSRWLIDRYGMERFSQLYATGDFEAVYERALESLVSDWGSFLDELPLTEGQLDQAQFRYDRAPIFQKRCARALAARLERARGWSSEHNYSAAVMCLESTVRDDPHNPSYRFELARQLRQAGELERARQQTELLLGMDGVGRVLRTHAEELLGDIAWTASDLQLAAEHYSGLLLLPLREGDLRRVTLKWLAVGDSQVAQDVYDHLLAAPPVNSSGLTARMMAHESQHGSPWLAYLIGLRLFLAAEYELAIHYLDKVVGAEVSLSGEAAIIWQARLRAAQSLYFIGRVAEARERFELLLRELDDSPVTNATMVQIADWIERCASEQ